MKVSRQQAVENREKVLDAASRMFREKGFDGVGVADLMKEAGLTHGGFYGQFSSKEELAAQACERALGQTARRWERLLEKGGDPLGRVIEAYLSPAHRDDPGHGCALATLGMEVPRRDPGVGHAFTAGLRSLVGLLERMLPQRLKAARRRQALALMSTLVGAMVLARAVDDAALSGEILESVRDFLPAGEDGPGA